MIQKAMTAHWERGRCDHESVEDLVISERCRNWIRTPDGVDYDTHGVKDTAEA